MEIYPSPLSAQPLRFFLIHPHVILIQFLTIVRFWSRRPSQPEIDSSEEKVKLYVDTGNLLSATSNSRGRQSSAQTARGWPYSQRRHRSAEWMQSRQPSEERKYNFNPMCQLHSRSGDDVVKSSSKLDFVKLLSPFTFNTAVYRASCRMLASKQLLVSDDSRTSRVAASYKDYFDASTKGCAKVHYFTSIVVKRWTT